MSSAVRVYKHLSIEHLLPKNYSVTAFVVLFIFYHVNLQVTENNNLQVVSLPVHFFELKQNRVHPSSCILIQQFNSFENLLTVSKYSYHFRFAEQDTLQKQNHFCSRMLLKEFHQLKTQRFQIQCDYGKQFFNSTKSNQTFIFHCSFRIGRVKYQTSLESGSALFDRKTRFLS